MPSLKESPFRIKLSFHIVGWMIFFFAPIILSPGRDMNTYFSEPRLMASLLIRNGLLMVLFYANLFYLTPALFTRTSQVKFFVLMALIIFVVGSGNFFIHEFLNGSFEGFSQRPPEPPSNFRPGHPFPHGDRPERRLMLASPYFSSLLMTALVAAASTLLVLWNNLIQAKADEQQRTLQKVAAELSVLKLQISPHFLFNTLNNIRWLVRSKSDLAEPALVKLSQLLRYILYQANTDFVGLDKEVAHLHDYITLQKMRLADGEKVQFLVAGELVNKKIVPLLLIPLVENFFKHGDFTNNARSVIELKVMDNKLLFQTKNRVLKGAGEEVVESGIGMTNVKKRLELHYPDKHQLKQIEQGDDYIVNLEIDLS